MSVADPRNGTETTTFESDHLVDDDGDSEYVQRQREQKEGLKQGHGHEHEQRKKQDDTQEGLSHLPSSELILRIERLEQQLKKTTAQLSAALTASSSPPPCIADNDAVFSTNLPSASRRQAKKQPRPFDASAYATRAIALKFSYLGHEYNGFEHANGSVAPPKPTIEEVLWKALRKARLISPSVPEGADASYDVVWDERDRALRYGKKMGRPGPDRLDVVWDGCGYSKCGRTDKGVSAFGQVIGITVRSNRPIVGRNKQKETQEDATTRGAVELVSSDVGRDEHEATGRDGSAGGDCGGKDDHTSPDSVVQESESVWDDVRDELSYISILNGILPPSIRILAWCPHPPEGFDARFSCGERRYKYFFTNPAFCPTPGLPGLRTGKGGTRRRVREGWLDIDAMRVAAKKLEGLHDFRNFCKIDAGRQMPNCRRQIRFADVAEFRGSSLGQFIRDARLNAMGTALEPMAKDFDVQEPKVCTFTVHGSAFLWHQVRCMVAILFLVGQGLETPDVVDRLLDIENMPGKPAYEMADDAPLVLWDCIFPQDGSGLDDLNWVYAGDESSTKCIAGKTDGKFGTGGLVSDLWTQWREKKLKEAMTASLLGLTLAHGDQTALERGGLKGPADGVPRSQRVYEGADNPRLVGDYVPVVQKPKMDTLELQNAKYLAGKKARRDARIEDATGGGD